MTTTMRLLILGAGGFGRAVAEAAEACGDCTVAGFADDRWPGLREVRGYPVVGSIAELAPLRRHADAVVVAIGDNAKRRAIFEQARAEGFQLASVIHPRAIVSPSARMGRGVLVMAGALVGPDARLGNGCIVGMGAIVDHDAQAGEFSQLSAGACMPGSSVLGDQAWLQENCALRPGGTLPAGQVIRCDARQGN